MHSLGVVTLWLLVLTVPIGLAIGLALAVRARAREREAGGAVPQTSDLTTPSDERLAEADERLDRGKPAA